MSYQAVQWALYDSPMLLTPSGKPDATARFVLVAHAERADEHGRDSHPGPSSLMRATGYDERTIERAELRLEAAGLLIRDGVSRHGTTRWHLALAKKRAEGEDDVDARISRRRAADAARQARRRERLKAPRQAPPATDVTDAESVTSRTQNRDVTHSESGCHGRSAPRTTQRTTQRTIQGTIPGGTLPPDPLRTEVPRSSAPRIESEISLSEVPQQPPQPETATHDRAREDKPPGLRLIASNEEPEILDAPDSLFPAAVPALTGDLAELLAEALTDPETPPARSESGHGFCLDCHASGQIVLAADPVNGSVCRSHLARSSA